VLLASDERILDFSEDAELAEGAGSPWVWKELEVMSSEFITCRKGDCFKLLDEAAIDMLSVRSFRKAAVFVSDTPREGDCRLCGDDASDGVFEDLMSASNNVQHTYWNPL